MFSADWANSYSLHRKLPRVLRRIRTPDQLCLQTDYLGRQWFHAQLNSVTTVSRLRRGIRSPKGDDTSNENPESCGDGLGSGNLRVSTSLLQVPYSLAM